MRGAEPSRRPGEAPRRRQAAWWPPPRVAVNQPRPGNLAICALEEGLDAEVDAVTREPRREGVVQAMVQAAVEGVGREERSLGLAAPHRRLDHVDAGPSASW